MLRSIVFILSLSVGSAAVLAEPAQGQFRSESWASAQPEAGVSLGGIAAGYTAVSSGMSMTYAALPGNQESSSAVPALLGSAGGWVGGMALGYAIGALVDRDMGDEYWPISGGATLGMLVGMLSGPPIGAHLTNRRRGNIGLSMLASIGTVAGVVALASTGGVDPVAALVVVPLAQIVVTGVVEHRTGR